MTIYDRAKATADRLLSPAKLGAAAGTITLSRVTITPSSNPWENPVETVQTETLKAQAFGVKSELIGTPANEPGGPVILASDLSIIAAVPAMGYRAGDLLAIDGRPVTIMRVENIPAAGTVSAVRFLVR